MTGERKVLLVVETRGFPSLNKEKESLSVPHFSQVNVSMGMVWRGSHSSDEF